ncbi:MAG: DUF3810 domain-containing protein [Clostridia bacterium]|nr:DUF3810 domain-containing protein [Clostridia bacterium]
MSRLSNARKNRVFSGHPLWLALIVAGVAALVLNFALRLWPWGAEYLFARGIGRWATYLVAGLTQIFPFSLGEILLLIAALGALPFIVGSIVFICKTSNEKAVGHLLRAVSGVLAVLMILYLLLLGANHSRYTVAENLDMDTSSPLSEQDLYQTALWLLEESGELAAGITVSEKGSQLPLGFYETAEMVQQGYDVIVKDMPFLSPLRTRPKPVWLSDLMAHTMISGIFTPYTGESNVNTSFPAFTIPATMAHELAHQRGIAREDEANFIAFLACIHSPDDYVRYSGYMSVLIYVLNDLYDSSSSLYKQAMETRSPKLRTELAAYNAYLKQFEGGTAEKVSSSINNAYLQAQGQKDGVLSYGNVTQWAVRWFLTLQIH